jgi:hypothetical protein
MTASGFMLFTRCLPRFSNGLANITATLGSFYWLGFETSDLSSDKKRLAWLGAQRLAQPPGDWSVVGWIHWADAGRLRRFVSLIYF